VASAETTSCTVVGGASLPPALQTVVVTPNAEPGVALGAARTTVIA